jgi:outer membrane protein OmpA-like peptidoglycan-associated protein
MKKILIALTLTSITLLYGCTTFEPYANEEKVTNTVEGAGMYDYMSIQEAKLREQLRGTGVSVLRDGDNIYLIMPGDITFPSAGSDLKANFYDVLDTVALVLNEYDRTVVAVAGYTDNVGSQAYNQSLSERRATSVARYLKTKDIKPTRFETMGFGEKDPLADNGSKEGRAINRRVELTLLPMEEDTLFVI